jgi:hypothetical protein
MRRFKDKKRAYFVFQKTISLSSFLRKAQFFAEAKMKRCNRMKGRMSDTQLKAELQAKEQLAFLGLAFRIDGLELADSIYVEIANTAACLVRHLRYDKPAPDGCAVYIDEMGWAPDLGGWVRGYEKVEKPYWLPKLLLNDLRQLENDLDDLSLLGRFAQ